ncbi:hypothetical protein A2U01_0095608, partial [Trifolium medium]|nr:hypothetical protein [Trifolium medium]
AFKILATAHSTTMKTSVLGT